jgi:hypothetical protein
VTATEGQLRKEGTIPLSAPVVLPVGRYSLTVVKTDGTDYCARYTDEVEVSAGATQHKTIRFLCGTQ